jgi:ferrous iron transport protein B
VWESASAFIKRAGTIILATTIVLWALLSYPKIEPDPTLNEAQQAQANIEASAAAHLGRAIEPVIEPLGFDWRIGVGLVASLAAREVIVATLAQIYAVGDSEDFESLRSALMKKDPVTGEPAFSLATALSLLVFFVFALQCTSTIVVMARETGGWKWPSFAFSYMLALAWLGSFVTYRIAVAFS